MGESCGELPADLESPSLVKQVQDVTSCGSELGKSGVAIFKAGNLMNLLWDAVGLDNLALAV